MLINCKIYEVNKGKNNQNAYICTIKKNEIKRLKLNTHKAFLLKVNNKIFASKMKKLGSKKHFIYYLSVPFILGKKFKNKSQIQIKILSKNLNNNKRTIKNGKIILNNILPKKTLRNFEIFKFKYKNKLWVWIHSRGCKLFSLPLQIPIENKKYNIFDLIGAFLCEGGKARKKTKHRDKLSFSNAEKTEITWFVKCCKNLLKINRNKWTVQIYINSKQNENKIKKYWQRLFKENNFYIYINETIKSDWGVCNIQIYNSSLAEVFDYLYIFTKKNVLKNENNAKNFIRGCSRGDLGVIIQKNNKIPKISFTGEKIIDVKLFKQACEKIGIKTTIVKKDKGKNCYSVWINNSKNVREILKKGLIVHPKRRKRASDHIITSKFFSKIKYLLAVKEGFDTSNTCGIFTKRSIITNRYFLAKLAQQGLLSYKTEKERPFKKIYTITNKGKNKIKEFLEIKNYVNIL